LQKKPELQKLFEDILEFLEKIVDKVKEKGRVTFEDAWKFQQHLITLCIIATLGNRRQTIAAINIEVNQFENNLTVLCRTSRNLENITNCISNQRKLIAEI
jgi:hypothetical protein